MIKKITFFFLSLFIFQVAFAQDNILPVKSAPFNEEVWRSAMKRKMTAPNNNANGQQNNGQGNNNGGNGQNGDSGQGNNQDNGNGQNGNGALSEDEKQAFEKKYDGGASYQEKRYRKEYENEQKRYDVEDKYKAEPLNLDVQKGVSGGETLIKTLVIILGVLLLAFLIYYFLGGAGASNKRLQNKEELQADLEVIEQNLTAANVETPLEKAIRTGEYRIAIRLYYLLVMQKLVQNGRIRWRKDKTNREYQYELAQQSFLPKFMVATLHYEKTWFGKEENITQDIFEHYKKTFDDLLSNI
jgi:hypothetical protein